MNRAELIEQTAEKAGLSKASAESALDAILDSVTSSLKQGEPVVLTNFGTFVVRVRAGREGRNPKTGEKIMIQSAKVISFKAGKGLKNAVKDTESAKEEVV